MKAYEKQKQKSLDYYYKNKDKILERMKNKQKDKTDNYERNRKAYLKLLNNNIQGREWVVYLYHNSENTFSCFSLDNGAIRIYFDSAAKLVIVQTSCGSGFCCPIALTLNALNIINIQYNGDNIDIKCVENKSNIHIEERSKSNENSTIKRNFKDETLQKYDIKYDEEKKLYY